MRVCAGPSARRAISTSRWVGWTRPSERPSVQRDSFKEPLPSSSTSANTASPTAHLTRLALPIPDRLVHPPHNGLLLPTPDRRRYRLPVVDDYHRLVSLR